MGAVETAQRTAERGRARRRAGAYHADHAAAAASCSALDVACSDIRRGPAERPGANDCRLHSGAWRLVLRRAGRLHRPVASSGRRGACRTGRPRPREFGQFRRVARPARAVRPAQAGRWGAPPPSHGDVRHGGFRSLGARSPAPPGAGRAAGRRRGGRARGAYLTAPLRRRVLAPARARGRLAAAVAGFCCAFTAGSRRAGTSAAAASSPASPANSSPYPKRSACCAR